MKLGIENLGIDGTLIAESNMTTIKMRHGDEGIKVWENAKFVSEMSKKQAQSILDSKDWAITIE